MRESFLMSTIVSPMNPRESGSLSMAVHVHYQRRHPKGDAQRPPSRQGKYFTFPKRFTHDIEDVIVWGSLSCR